MRRRKFSVPGNLDAGYLSAFYGQKSYNGVAILSKSELDDVQKEFSRRRLTNRQTSDRRDRQWRPHRQHIHSKRPELWTDKFMFKLDWIHKLLPPLFR